MVVSTDLITFPETDQRGESRGVGKSDERCIVGFRTKILYFYPGAPTHGRVRGPCDLQDDLDGSGVEDWDRGERGRRRAAKGGEVASVSEDQERLGSETSFQSRSGRTVGTNSDVVGVLGQRTVG